MVSAGGTCVHAWGVIDKYAEDTPRCVEKATVIALSDVSTMVIVARPKLPRLECQFSRILHISWWWQKTVLLLRSRHPQSPPAVRLPAAQGMRCAASQRTAGQSTHDAGVARGRSL